MAHLVRRFTYQKWFISSSQIVNLPEGIPLYAKTNQHISLYIQHISLYIQHISLYIPIYPYISNISGYIIYVYGTWDFKTYSHDIPINICPINPPQRSTFTVRRRRVDVGEKVWTRVGTPAFWAPEVRFLVELLGILRIFHREYPLVN